MQCHKLHLNVGLALMCANTSIRISARMHFDPLGFEVYEWLLKCILGGCISTSCKMGEGFNTIGLGIMWIIHLSGYQLERTLTLSV